MKDMYLYLNIRKDRYRYKDTKYIEIRYILLYRWATKYFLYPSIPVSLWRAGQSLLASACWFRPLPLSLLATSLQRTNDLHCFMPELIDIAFQCGWKSILSLTWLLTCTHSFPGCNSTAPRKLGLRHDLMAMVRKLNNSSLEASDK